MSTLENLNLGKKKFSVSGDFIFITITRMASFIPLTLFVLFCMVIVIEAWPSIKTFQLGFLWHTNWNPVSKQFGALGAIEGTLITTLIAMIVAIPLSFGVANFIVFYLKKNSLKRFLANILDLMAGIPSIVYGMWGLYILAPFLQTHIMPFLNATLSELPLFNYLLGYGILGLNLLTAGIILALMIIPLIASVMRDVLSNVSTVLQEAAYGVGCTKMEVILSVAMPYAKGGVMGGIVLGVGRALGETMAVAFVIGNSHTGFRGLLLPGTTISASIASEFEEAVEPLYRSALIELGLILLIITIIVLIIINMLRSNIKRGGNL